MQNVIINGNTYEEVQKVQIPLSDGSGNADFVDTSIATAKAENIEKGFNAFVNGELIVGTKEEMETPFYTAKIGTYNWSNPEGTTLTIESCMSDINAYLMNRASELGQTGTPRMGLLFVADEKPSSTAALKGVMCAATFNISKSIITDLRGPIIYIMGAYYGGIDGMGLEVLSSAQNQTEGATDITISTAKTVECTTCTVYGFEVNF